MYQLERYEEAIVSLDKVLKINSNDYYSWGIKSDALCKLKRYEDSLFSYIKALKINRDFFELIPENMDIMLNLLKMNNDNVFIWYEISLILLSLGKYQQAIGICEKVLKVPIYESNRQFYDSDIFYELNLLSKNGE